MPRSHFARDARSMVPSIGRANGARHEARPGSSGHPPPRYEMHWMGYARTDGHFGVFRFLFTLVSGAEACSSSQ